MAARFADRVACAQSAMIQANCDILVVTNRENLIYFTGVTQMECLAVLITKDGEACAIALWLDADYIREQSGMDTHAYFFPRQSLGEKIVERIKAFGFSEPSIGFERYFVDFAVYEALRSNFPEKNFKGVGELFYKLRSVKDPEEVSKIRNAAKAASKGMEAAMKAVQSECNRTGCPGGSRVRHVEGGIWRIIFSSPSGFR